MGQLLCVIFFLAVSASAEVPPLAPVKIGAVYGFTGFASVWSSQAKKGIEIARDEINSSGGIHGRPLEIIFEDSGTTPRGAVSAFNKLVRVDRVQGVVGDILSFLTLPLVPIAQRNNLVLVTPSIFDTDLPRNSAFFFSTCPRKESIYAPVEEFFELNPEIKKIAIICADNTWGRTYLDVWTSVAKSRGVRVVDENCISEYSSDMRTEILRAKSHNPDGLIVAFGIDHALKRMQELKFHPKILTTSDLDEAIEARALPPLEAEGVYFADWLPSNYFLSQYRARYQDAPIMAPQNSYEALKVLALGLRRSSPTDSSQRDPSLRDPSLRDPSQALESAISELIYEGGTGPVNFRNSHAGNYARATLMVVANGKIVAAPGTRQRDRSQVR